MLISTNAPRAEMQCTRASCANAITKQANIGIETYRTRHFELIKIAVDKT